MAEVTLHEVLSDNRDARYLRKLAERTEEREYARLTQLRTDKTEQLDRQAQNAIDADTTARQRAEAARTETREVLRARENASQRLADEYDRAAEARARDAAAESRSLDAEQALRDQQLEEDLRALELQRQDAVGATLNQERLSLIAAAREEGQAVPRGHFLDLVA